MRGSGLFVVSPSLYPQPPVSGPLVAHSISAKPHSKCTYKKPEKSNVKSIIITASRPSAVGSRQPIRTLVAYENRRKSAAVLARERRRPSVS